ncbi:unnamed protein product [Calypogeia fissa]
MVETYLKCVTKAMRADTNQLVLQCQAYQEQEMVELRSQLNVKEANLLDLKNQLDVVNANKEQEIIESKRQLDAMNANKEQEILELKRQLDAVKLEKQEEVNVRELLEAKVDTLQSKVYDGEEKEKQWRTQFHQDLQQNNAELREELKLSKKSAVSAYQEVHKRDRDVKTSEAGRAQEITRRKCVEVEAINARIEVWGLKSQLERLTDIIVKMPKEEQRKWRLDLAVEIGDAIKKRKAAEIEHLAPMKLTKRVTGIDLQ